MNQILKDQQNKIIKVISTSVTQRESLTILVCILQFFSRHILIKWAYNLHIALLTDIFHLLEQRYLCVSPNILL